MSPVATLVGSLALAGPSAGYQTSRDSYSGVSSTDPDMAPLLVGILVLTGLAILFPSYINLTTVRRKRSAVGGQGKRSPVDRPVFQRNDIDPRPRLPGGLRGCRGPVLPLSQHPL